MSVSRQFGWKCVRQGAVALLLAACTAGSVFAQAPAPNVVSSSGYINGTPLSTHTTSAFDSRGASALVAFVSTNPTWNNLPVSVSGLTDSAGNTWNILTGPTTFSGNTFTLLSAIYYVTGPVTSATHTVTATLTNNAPLVLHVFAVSGTDLASVPIYSPIGDPSPRLAYSNVMSAPIAVPANTLLLSWVKNESDATAVALGGYTLDAQSTTFLWAESGLASAAGSYSSHFDFNVEVGWQSAIVGLKASNGPVANNQSVATDEAAAVGITLTAVSPTGATLTYAVQAGPAHGTLSGAAPALTYTPAAGYIGADAFTFTANDGTGDSNLGTINLTVRGPNHAPLASNSNATVAGSAGAVSLTASDADNDSLTYVIVAPPAHGHLATGTGANQTYTPTPGYIGADSFTFQVSDGRADSNVATVNITVQAVGPPPTVVSSVGYISTAPFATHTTTTIDTRGASTLVAYVSTHPVWNGLPVSISSVTDSVGNSWQVLTGPVSYTGNAFTLMSALFYVTVPATSATYSLTVNLTNAAPLVVHVFAVMGADLGSLPIYAPITDPGPGGTTTDVVSAPITVPANTLLLSWVKNDSAADAAALDGYTLDAQSVGFLWGESQPMTIAGDYTGHFQYDTAIAWQTTIVGLKPSSGPVAFNQSVTTDQATAVAVTLTATSPGGASLTYAVQAGPAHGTLNGAAPALTYTPAPGYTGADAFTFTVNDGTSDSNTATVSVTVRGPNHVPVAGDSSVTIAGSVGVTSLTATDADNDSLTYAIVTPPAHGQLSAGTSATRVYTPTPGYVGADSFRFRASDGRASSNTATVSVTVQAGPSSPGIVGHVGYINGTPLAAHTTTAIDTRGASTLVAFVSTDTPWNGQPVSLNGLTDSAGNAWNVLTGPTTYAGSAFTQMSAVYYVSAPVTSAAYTLTVNLTNPAPLVLHVFAVAGTDITTLPIYAPITDPGPGGATVDVLSASIAVPGNTLLLSWVKNDSSANAAAMSGYTLDSQSTSFLWAESELVSAAGSYSGDFQYDTPIAWQTAIVGLPGTAPAPSAFTVTVLAPNGGEKVFAGTATTVRWSVGGTGTPAAVDLALSRDDGATFTAIPECTNLAGTATSCNWTPSGAATTTARIRVTARDGGTGSVTDTSDAAFTVASAPSVAVTSPNTAASWLTGTVRSIAWQHNLGASEMFRIQLSRDGGSTWETIAASVPASTATTGSFSWSVAGPPTTAALVKVDSLDLLASDTSHVTFSIVTVGGSPQGVAPPGTPPRVVFPGDFDGDGRPDLLSQIPSGNVTVALNHGSGFDTVQHVFDDSSAWRVVGVADLNNDGHADIIWQGPTGSVAAWLMNTAGGTQTAVIYGGDSTWRVVGIADIDHDGFPDLVWQSPTGQVVVWFMQGASLLRAVTLWSSASDWQIVGVGDFNGDGDPDLLWQGSTGALVLWTLHGSTVAATQFAYNGQSAWKVVGVGDVDGDGKPDVLWQGPTGQIVVWLVSDTTPAGFTLQSLYLNSLGLQWAFSTTPQ